MKAPVLIKIAALFMAFSLLFGALPGSAWASPAPAEAPGAAAPPLPEDVPSPSPTAAVSQQPSPTPSPSDAQPSDTPSSEPSAQPSDAPEQTVEPSAQPSPTARPTPEPQPTARPTPDPQPTAAPAAIYVTFESPYGRPSTQIFTVDADGRLPKLPTATRAGCVFAGWYTQEEGGGREISLETVFHEDTTVYARWEVEAPASYTVTFDPNGGTLKNTRAETDANGRLSLLPKPSWEGHTFDGWYTAKTGGGKVSLGTVFTQDATIYARWSAGSLFSVTFHPNGGTVSPSSAVTDAAGRLSDLPTPTREGYVFDGWFSSVSTGDRISTSYRFYKNATIYAHWTAADQAQVYTVSFDPRGGSVRPTTAQTRGDGTLESLPTPHRNGYTFDGWYTSPSGGDPVTQAYLFSGNTTVYAQWSEGAAATYTITFRANGGTVRPTSAATRSNGTLASLPSPVRTGYVFSGWYTRSDGGERVTTDTVFTSDALIYAHWSTQDAPVLPDGGQQQTGGQAVPGSGQTSPGSAQATPSSGGIVPPEERLPGSRFVDVRAGAYYAQAVQWAVERNITQGTSETTFSPESPCSRGQIVTFLWRRAGQPAPKRTGCPFTDVEEDAYYYKAMLWAVENDITFGTSETTFSPDSPCSRGEIVTFLWRRSGSPFPETTTSPFTDVRRSGYYYNAMLWAVGRHITNGTSETTFSPESVCSRGQIVTLLYRAG